MVDQPHDPTPALHRHVEPTRRRQLWWWALAGTAAANAALTMALGARASSGAGGFAIAVHVEAAAPAPAPVVVVQAPAPAAAIAAPPPAPTVATPPAGPFADLGPCPAPYAARPRGALTQPTDYGSIVGIATSPTDSRLVAAWTQEALFVSRDGGHGWTRLLDGDGDVLDASFDCHGRPLVVRRGGGLGIFDGGRERWRPIDGLAMSLFAREPTDTAAGEVDDSYRPRLIGGGRSIAISGAAQESDGERQQLAAITDDSGASWRRVDLGWWENGGIRGEWTGDTLRMAVPWTDCMSEGINLVTVGASGTRTTLIGEWTGDLALSGGALLAAPSLCGLGSNGGACVWRGNRWKPLPADLHLGDGEEVTLLDGPVDVVMGPTMVYRVGPHGFDRGRPWDQDWEPTTSDRSGRLWGLDAAGQLLLDDGRPRPPEPPLDGE